MFTLVNIIIAAMLALGAGNIVQWWMWGRSANSYKAQIQELEAKNLQQEMTIKAKDKELADKGATLKVRRKVQRGQAEIDKVVGDRDDPAMRRLGIERGMLRKDKDGIAPGRPGGDPKPSRPRNAQRVRCLPRMSLSPSR